MKARLLDPEAGPSLLLLGNEAIVRGALEARVAFASGYPGTPASEIGETFAALHAQAGLYFEWSVNEKVALEAAFGASLTGARSLVSMKHLGLVYAGDPLSTIPYIGTVGGMVVVAAADPSCHTSPNEQDQRHIGRMLGLPTLDPATPEEARAMTRAAFELSEAAELPVLLRITARVAHTRAPVSPAAFGPDRPAPAFVRRPERFVPVPASARRLRLRLGERLEIAERWLAASPFCPKRPGSGRRGLITTGAPHLLALDALESFGLASAVPVLRMGALHPLPDEPILAFLRELDEVLVVEELTPYLEDSLLAMAHHYRLPVRIEGKRSGAMPWPYEIGPDVLFPALRRFLGLPADAAATVTAPPPAEVPPRPPSLCPGCPHSATFVAARIVFGDAVYVNDIGCYTLGHLAPHEAGDVLLSMGASLPIAAAIARTTGRRTVAMMGDSTFFHSGMPALANATARDDDVVLLVLDNQATSMTGHQPSFTSPVDRAGQPRPSRSIAEVARALGVADVETVDPHDLPATIAALTRARDAHGPRVVIAERPCPLYAARAVRPAERPVNAVSPTRCHTCGMREAGLACGLPESPALDRHALGRRAADHELFARAFPEGPPPVAPCTAACPIGICVQAYVGAIAVGEPASALAAVIERAALPSVCSHLCHRPCEDRCIRETADGALAINELKRYLTEASGVEIRHPGSSPSADAPRVAIVGAGPAGLAAARDLVRRGYRVVVFDAADQPGGALRLIPEHRLPGAVLARDLAALFALGIEFRGGVRLGRDVQLADLSAEGFVATLLALGAGRVRAPAIPGDDSALVVDALAFLGEGERPMAGHVAVIGGGDVAVDAARMVMRRGARATILALESEENLPADRGALREAIEEGVVIRPGLGLAAIESREGRCRLLISPVESITLDADGTLRPKLKSNTGTLRCERVILATGLVPDTGALELGGVATVGPGWLSADPYGATSNPHVFVAGDVTLGAANVTRAMASGVRAAYAIDRCILGDAAAPCRAPLDAERPPNRGARVAGRRAAPLSEAEARAEAQRCLLCSRCARCDACMQVVGCPAFARGPGPANTIDPALCIACDYCTGICPNAAVLPARATS